MLRFTKLLCFLLLFAHLHAQNSKGIFSGKLTDTSGKNAVAFATITIFKAKDTAIITYRLSDPNGNFKVPGLPFDIGLRAVITSSGLSVYRKEFTLNPGQPQVDIGTLKMQPDIKSLDEVLVYSERPPVTVKNDTVEFNASAFKTLPSALVEDLLKKLPGVDVDVDGAITVNGRKVNRILVDGREFFGGDPKVATKNLPANLVDKVQVVDDKEELDKNPEITKADLGQVLNIKLKRSIKKGWFGKAYAGAGSNGNRGHYESGAIINSFRDTFQVSVLGYSNNINKAGFGFNDLEQLGGFKRSGFNSVSTWTDGGVSINDISFGGTGQGIQQSSGSGVNLNHDPTKKLNYNFQYFFGQIISNYNSKSNSQQFFSDTVLTTRSSTIDKSSSNNHRFGSKITWKKDSFSTFVFRPNLAIRLNNSAREYFSDGSSSYQPKLNESENLQRTDARDLSYNHELTYNRVFKKKGRTLFMSNNLSIGDIDHDQVNNAENVFYNGQTTVTTLNQNREKRTNNRQSSLQLNFTEKLSKQFSVRISNYFNYFKNNDDLTTYDWDPLSGKYEVLNNTLSNGLERTGNKLLSSATLIWSHKKLQVSPGVSYNRLYINNNYLKNPDLVQRNSYVFPSLLISWNGLNIGYRANVMEPSAYDLQPVVDNTNQLYQNFGNPDLVPTIFHGVNVGFFKYDKKSQVNFNFNGAVNFQENAIIRERTVDNRGAQTTRPVNVNGVFNFYSNGGFSKSFKFSSNWRFSIRPGFNLSSSRNYVIVNNVRSKFTTWGPGSSITWAFNWKDLFEFNQRYSVFWQRTKYDSDAYKDLRIASHYATSEIVIRMPKNWVWESTVDYRYNPNVATGFSKNIVRWNAGINYLFLKEKKGQLKIFVFDILKQNTSAFRFVRENFIQDTESNALTRYVMLSFTYNIRDFKAGKVGGRNNFFFF